MHVIEYAPLLQDCVSTQDVSTHSIHLMKLMAVIVCLDGGLHVCS